MTVALAPGRSPALAPARRASDTRRRSGLPRSGKVGAVLVGLFAVAGVVGPSLAGYAPTELAGGSLEAPSAAHLMGTNQVNQDLASQLLHGARAALVMALLAGGGTVLLGLAVGVAAGWSSGGRVDAALMTLVDLLVATPRLPLMLLVGTFVGGSLLGLAVLMSAVAWPGPARMIRAHVRTLKSRLHVRAASSFGASSAQVVRRHVLPELSLVALTALVAAAGRAIMFETGLAFLGLGDPSRVSWGTIIRDANGYGNLYYTAAYLWWMLPPIIAMTAVLLGFTLLSTSLEQRVNPRVARHLGRVR